VKILVTHDQQGSIKSVSVPGRPEPGFEGRLALKPRSDDEMVSEVEVSDVQRDNVHHHVREILAHYRIADHPDNPRLVKKRSGS
jgi:hypothetical protein